jgi:uncharacterized protein
MLFLARTVLFIGPSVRAQVAGTLLICTVVGLAHGLSFPALTGRVVDQANIIPAANRSAMEVKLRDLEEKSGIQLVVATVTSLQGSEIEIFANELFRNWKLGEAKRNNGILLLVAPNEHKVRIEVGYGLEGTLTDALSNVIVSSAIVPRVKAGDYAGGIERGVDGIISILTTDAAEWQPKANVRNDDRQTLLDVLLPLIIFAVFIFVFRTMVSHARGSSGRVRRGGETIFIPYGGSPWSGRSSGSSWGGGSTGDGDFSGGGGSSGGGGASGSW